MIYILPTSTYPAMLCFTYCVLHSSSIQPLSFTPLDDTHTNQENASLGNLISIENIIAPISPSISISEHSTPAKNPIIDYSSPTVIVRPPSISNHSRCNRGPPPYLQDYVCNQVSSSTKFSLGRYFSLSHFKQSDQVFLSTIVAHNAPRSFSQAMKSVH